ncbi:hypothetical protein Emed_007090 [Eimeria media]
MKAAAGSSGRWQQKHIEAFCFDAADGSRSSRSCCPCSAQSRLHAAAAAAAAVVAAATTAAAAAAAASVMGSSSSSYQFSWRHFLRPFLSAAPELAAAATATAVTATAAVVTAAAVTAAAAAPATAVRLSG